MGLKPVDDVAKPYFLSSQSEERLRPIERIHFSVERASSSNGTRQKKRTGSNDDDDDDDDDEDEDEDEDEEEIARGGADVVAVAAGGDGGLDHEGLGSGDSVEGSVGAGWQDGRRGRR
ncbi:hypothetical protein V1478_015134 [Vespula squamosa]|uniref:Uncharacterized protein n=1 Tax=Vespula squamosa TaxID=30214 RepID=A0ABD2A4A2_VESSQ